MLPTISGVTTDGTISYNHVSNIRQIWPVILPGLVKVKETNGEPWIPEDIYAALMTGNASLYAGYRQGAYTGFAVLQAITFPYEDSPVLNVWIGYSVEKSSGHLGAEAARHVANEAGIERVVFSSPQEGWTAKYKKITTWYEV